LRIFSDRADYLRPTSGHDFWIPTEVVWSARPEVKQQWHSQVEHDHDQSDNPHGDSKLPRKVECQKVGANGKLDKEHGVHL
jgi:hypothetical protein